MISLRDYQESAVARLRTSVMQHKRSILVATTGAGKTRMALRIIQGAVLNGKVIWFVVHRRELCNQTSREFWKAKVEHGMIMSGRARSTMQAQVGTILTAANRVGSMKRKPDIIIIDEAHRSVSSSYIKLLDACPDAIVIGLTATPQRTDGRGLGQIYRDLVEVEPMRWLMDNGYLCDYKLIAPPSSLDMSGVKTKMGDYDTAETEKAIDRPSITGDAIKVYRQYVDGKRCMVFCVTIKHSQHVCDQYNAAGIPAEHIDGTHSDAEREGALSRFRSGQTLILTTVQLAIEGLDIPAVEAVQLLRPTKSVIVYLQIIGRGLRTEPGKTHLYILDQVRNWEFHGLPDDDREWSLDSSKKRAKKASDEDDIKVKQCGHCWAVFKPGPDKCPNCGAPVVNAPRMIEQIEGEVVEIDVTAVRRERKQEQGQARTLSDLIALGIRRGMQKPAQWAAITVAARAGQKPTAQAFRAADEIYRGLKNGL
jgi:DNA repair protein RadD